MVFHSFMLLDSFSETNKTHCSRAVHRLKSLNISFKIGGALVSYKFKISMIDCQKIVLGATFFGGYPIQVKRFDIAVLNNSEECLLSQFYLYHHRQTRQHYPKELGRSGLWCTNNFYQQILHQVALRLSHSVASRAKMSKRYE